MLSTTSMAGENMMGALRVLDDGLQGMSGPSGQGYEYFGLRLRDLPGIHARQAPAVQVDLHHYPVGFRRRLLEERLQDVYDELHRRVVVVQQDHAEPLRLLRLVADAFLDRSARLVLIARHS